MPPAASAKASTSKKAISTLKNPKPSTKKTSTLTLEKAAGAGKKAVVKPISQFVSPISAISLSQGETPSGVKTQEKGKVKEIVPDVEDRLWVDLYEPLAEAELAVHKRKLEDVRRWLLEALDGGPSGRLKKYRRILALTGPAGSGKTASLRVLAKELDLEIVEWRNGMDDGIGGDYTDYESLSLKFQNFLDRASAYRSLSFPSTTTASSSKPSSSSQSNGRPRFQIILLEDLPNILHAATREAFHSALTAFATSSEPPSCPLVFVVSDSGARGEAKDEKGGYGGGFAAGQDDAVDVRAAIPPSILNGPYCTHLSFNPIAPTLMRKAINALLGRVFSSSSVSHQKPSKEVVDIIVDSANGDIRSAIMALQFACIVDLPGGARGKGKGKGGKKGARGILEAITQREQSLVLFHLLGKLLYNKRYGDPEDEEEAPYRIKLLPKHLRNEHSRRLSKVDTNILYADSPVDTSLISLYVHQNYTQFCENVEECDGVMANLSSIDSIRESDLWPLTASLLPHTFQMLALGTLHALPSPVTRRGQKTYKPEFFSALSRAREAEVGVAETRAWLDTQQEDGASSALGGWSTAAVVLETGGVLKARTAASALAPPSHSAFSTFMMEESNTSRNSARVAEEDDNGEADLPAAEDEEERYANRPTAVGLNEKADHGWLSDDDIEDS